MRIPTLDKRFDGRLRWYSLPPSELETYRNLAAQYQGDWVDYEGYMRAGCIFAEPWRDAVLLVRFHKHTGIDQLGLHRHPHSDRQVIVLHGSGSFHYGLQPQSIAVSSGIYVEFPKGTVHTFTTGHEDMEVLSIHRPFIPFDDETCIDMCLGQRSNEK